MDARSHPGASGATERGGVTEPEWALSGTEFPPKPALQRHRPSGGDGANEENQLLREVF